MHVYVWFDVEDYINPEDDDVTLRLASMLEDLGVRALFKLVGEKARALERRGRTDVIDAIRQHDVGYHTDMHSRHPVVTEYLEGLGWDEGAAEFIRRESRGLKDVERIIGKRVVAYGQPGQAWAPQVYEALRRLGIRLYVSVSCGWLQPPASPFMLNGVLCLSRLPHMIIAVFDVHEEAWLRRSLRIAERCMQEGGLLGIMAHPTNFLAWEWWDIPYYAHGENREHLYPKLRIRMKDPRLVEQGLSRFRELIARVLNMPKAEFLSAEELLKEYAEAPGIKLSPGGLRRAIIEILERGLTYVIVDGIPLSPADLVATISAALLSSPDEGVELLPASSPPRLLPSAGRRRAALADVLDMAEYLVKHVRAHGALPASLPQGVHLVDFAALLLTLAYHVLVEGRRPERVEARPLRLVLAEELLSKELAVRSWRWEIFPPGFQAWRLFELSKVLAWSYKPALPKRTA